VRIPRSTYRLQITAAFDLAAAEGVLDYVVALGADWIYLSPLLTSADGSDHGYDVVDHASVDPVRGGPEGLRRLAAAVAAAGRGILVDIVPNHMGVDDPHRNGWWWDLLRSGQDSRSAEAFDVDWAAGGGKVLLPALGDEAPGEGSELDRLEVVGDELRYHDHRFPIAPGTAGDGADARTVHARQHYALVNWRRADRDLNYRRFFAVNSLAGIRVEVPWVFDESHREIVRWVREGLVQGIRVDHPDGLADPGGYLDRLRHATDGTYVLVEKILEGDEALPTSWATRGTTGYDALADVDRIFVDPAGRPALDALEQRLQADSPAPGPGENDRPATWAELVSVRKRASADGILNSEVRRIARLMPGVPEHEAIDGLAELLTALPVYRSYLPLGFEQLDEAGRRACERRPDLAGAVDRLLPVLADPRHPAAVRFQQTSGMVMAKGVEDTSYYRYSRLTSLNEVGADPSEFAIDAATFHTRQQKRAATYPDSMTTLSTHDTKRAEDVRARISVIAEIPAEWEATLDTLRTAVNLGDGPLENLLWQAVIGCWPASRERLAAFALKAARESGTSTSWNAPDAGFEAKLDALVDAVFDDPSVTAALTGFVERVQQAGWSNSLSAKVVQLTMPGVPDVYQGSELWETSLVDPDNRRPVDYAARRSILARIDGGWLPPVDESGAAKLLVTSRALRQRRDAPERFFRHASVPAFGSAAAHLLAFDRGDAVTIATRLPLGLAAGGGWRDTTIVLAERPVIDVITGERFAGGTLLVRDLLHRYPVALLVPDPRVVPHRGTDIEATITAGKAG
jgi:(1->4)-alpha-D-glucan 1-alpha-D-glucosylmutase